MRKKYTFIPLFIPDLDNGIELWDESENQKKKGERKKMKTKSKSKTCNVASLALWLCEWVSNEEEEQPLSKRKNNQYIYMNLYMYMNIYMIHMIYIIYVWVICYCWGNSSMVEGRFSKWF